VSATVGTSGSAVERFSVVTAIARSVPALMCSIDDGMLSKQHVDRAGDHVGQSLPDTIQRRDRHVVILIPVIALNISPDMCHGRPVPEDAMLILPGWPCHRR